MMSLIYVFWMYVVLFAIIGALRGWAKELLVAFSVIVAVALNTLLTDFMPVVKALPDDDPTLFWIRTSAVIALVYFGYQTVISLARLQAASRREHLQDSLFGIFLGAVNGYLIAGTIWFYLDQAKYPWPTVIAAPTGELATKVLTIMNYMPPHLLGNPGIYFALVIVLVFILVVYV
jgi:hypothetical protein